MSRPVAPYRQRARPFGDDFPTVATPDPGPEQHAEANWDGARVRELVAELPERQRTIIKLRHFFERTPAEIQEYMGITPRTYRRQLERAMPRFSTTSSRSIQCR
jgi:RNA polymerase sigma factor (sigma-70 family)